MSCSLLGLQGGLAQRPIMSPVTRWYFISGIRAIIIKITDQCTGFIVHSVSHHLIIWQINTASHTQAWSANLIYEELMYIF